MNKTRVLVFAACLIALAGCSKKAEKEAEPIVPVQVTEVKLDSIRRIVTSDAVLYPRNQASVVPKISAPVKKIHVNRGDHVKEGQLLAVLENRDLAAAAMESKGMYEQAEASYKVTSGASVPEELTKSKADRSVGQTVARRRSKGAGEPAEAVQRWSAGAQAGG